MGPGAGEAVQRAKAESMNEMGRVEREKGERVADWVTDWMVATIKVVVAATSAPGHHRTKLIERGFDEIERMAEPEKDRGAVAWIRATLAWAAERMMDAGAAENRAHKVGEKQDHRSW